MLAALGLRYGTDEAIDFAVEIQKTLALEAYRASVAMAKERGKFPMYDPEREKNNPMIARIREADPALYEEMTEHGRRNIAMLTIAPTGTTSLMSQTTSGIEPVFRPVYTRRRKVNPSDKDVKITFVDEVGDSWEEYNVFHHKFLVWLETNGYDLNEVKSMSAAEIEKLVALSPYYKATANDIDWVSKVRMQGAIQKWVDHSISVTVNLPNEVTEELVGKVYMTAWEHGCKGVTVYRDGSRAGVLVESKKKKKGAAKTEESETAEGGYRPPRKRPIELTADIVRFKNGEEDWIAFVGIYNDRPYEIFTGKIEEDAMFIPKKIKKGVILKVVDSDGRKRYDFQYKDKYGYTNTIGGISRLFDKQFWNYAKLISGVLRNGMPILDVVTLIESLQLDSESINTWKNGVARALKQYIANGTKVKEKCPNCGQETLVYQNSCPVCMSCGYSGKDKKRCGRSPQRFFTTRTGPRRATSYFSAAQTGIFRPQQASYFPTEHESRSAVTAGLPAMKPTVHTRTKAIVPAKPFRKSAFRYFPDGKRPKTCETRTPARATEQRKRIRRNGLSPETEAEPQTERTANETRASEKLAAHRLKRYRDKQSLPTRSADRKC